MGPSREERILQVKDVSFRVNGPISNTPEFAQAFRCKPDARMVRTHKCEVW